MTRTIVPKMTMLDQESIDQVLDAAYGILEKTGFALDNREGLELMADAGASVDRSKSIVRLTAAMIDSALKSVPSGFPMWDQLRKNTVADLSGDKIHFVTGGTAIAVQDFETEKIRQPVTRDMVEHTRVMDTCRNITFSSATFTLSDVPKEIADTYRFFMSLLYSGKPVMATAFSREGYRVMKEMMTVMAGDEATLKNKPAHVFYVNNSSPLGWSDLTSQNLIDAARDEIPVKVIPIPLGGGTAPVTLMGNLVQITAEQLGSLVLHQTVKPGARYIYGGGPAVMDMRFGTSPMACLEALLMGSAHIQIGKHLGLPTSTNLGRSDSKHVDAQAGMETGMAMLTAALSGANVIRGSGMLDFATTQSLEKLVLDNEICGICLRMRQGMECSPETLAAELIGELAHAGNGYVQSAHTFQWYRRELYFPSEIIDRNTRSAHQKKGAQNARQRAHDAVRRILETPDDGMLEDDHKRMELWRIMKDHARRNGIDHLPIEGILGK
jgi:trimethylamine---corrinoid protein Co-methyltransferase